MSFNLIEYYKALNGESSLSNDTWHINYDKRHAFRVYSDVDGFNPSTNSMYLPPAEETTETISTFSDKSGQKINNTKIVIDGDGTESIELELADRIVTIVMDQSGSMTWNDDGKFRHEIAQDLVDKIDINYPGDIRYNLIDYGAKFINVLLYGLIEEDGINPYDIDSLNAMFLADENANYDGIRVLRNDTAYPSSPLDGEIVNDGFVSRILDDELIEGQTYYYTIYTYDNLGRFSEGVNIKVTPRDRAVPRGISVFRTTVETQDLSLGEPFTGTGINRDANTIGIWHMDEGEGKFLYDFSDTSAILEYSKEDPIWYDTRFVPAGNSGLFFDGENDYAFISGEPDLWRDIDDTQPEITIMAWVFPYKGEGLQIIVSSQLAGQTSYRLHYNGLRLQLSTPITGFMDAYITDDDVLELNKWQHIAATRDSSGVGKIYVNGISKNTSTTAVASFASVFGYFFSIGTERGSLDSRVNHFYGKITEVSVHGAARSSTYINAQLIDNPILNDDGIEVDTEIIGIKDDNGDRLVVLDYEIPEDYNFSGGEVIIVKNEKHIPSWEEDGTIIYQETATTGQTFVSDSDDFALGEKYYYRIFSKNSLGNVSFQSDSPSLEISIPQSLTDDYFVALSSAIPNSEEPDGVELITPGNEKVYLRWKQNSPLDSRISRVKIYYSSEDFPVVSSQGGNINQLVFTGLPTDEKFVHRYLSNNASAYYTIVNVDKYGRPSGYNPDGIQAANTNLLQASTTPTLSSAEGTIPLVDVSNINYEIRDNSAISIGWDQSIKSPEDIEAYFDQTVLVYASLTDSFGDVLPEYASIKMLITSNISRETQADDVFDSVDISDFDDKDAYDFFVTRTDQGFLKATLRMTTNSRIISQIKEATFKIQLKSIVPKEGGYTSPNTADSSTNPLSEYASLIAELTGEEDSAAETETSDNVFEYVSQEFTVHYTNPWEITLESKYDNQRVYERCYYQKTDKLTGDKSLGIDNEMFYGVPMRASFPFVARAKVEYKGEPVENTSIRVAVWDADSSNLCAAAGAESEDPFGFQGDKLQTSQTVIAPDANVSVLQGTESIPGPDGELVDNPISYIDIPLQAPDMTQAVRLFVKGEKAGYSSVKDMYILFQSLLRTEMQAHTPNEDGADVREQFAQAYVIHPDYPDLTDPHAQSLTTPVADLTVVQWDFILISGENSRTIYSTDVVPVTNGIYSYTRNGHARNVFLGPIQIEGKAFEETHEISVTVVYEGMTSQAKSFMNLEYDPTESTTFGAKFLMEVDGGWRNDGTYGGGGWMDPESSNALWSDGSHYKKMKIHRNPAGDPQFAASTAFNDCASQDDSQVFELNSGQIVEVIAGGDEIEILHGDISEELDPYTGKYSLVVGEDGFIDNGNAFIELENEEDSDVTYFYIRANSFVPGSGMIRHDFLFDEDPINDCLKLNPVNGLFKRDLPRWSPYFTVSGKTTLFVNDQPLVLSGGGDFSNGIPPCPICLNEPLIMSVVWRKVTNYFYSEELGDPSNDFIYPVVINSDNNQFTTDGDSLINNQSQIDIRVRISWRGEVIPDGTPVYTSIGDNTSSTLFLAGQSVYYTQIDDDEGYSYVDVRLAARRIPTVTTTEDVRIYTTYDENGKTERNVGADFSLTIDIKDTLIEIPIFNPEDPVTGIDPPSAFTGVVERYDITSNDWITVSSMSEGKGNFFHGESNGKIYVMGGLLNNSLNISSKTEEYEVTSNDWQSMTIMPTPRFGGMSVTIENNIYTIGGIFSDAANGDNLSISNAMEVYDASTDSWNINVENMPIVNPGTASEERLGVAFGVAQHVVIDGDNYIYIIGGVSDIIVNSTTFSIEEHSKRILRYHVENNIWEYSDRLRSNELNTYQRIYPLTFTYDNKIIVFNGAIESGFNFIYPSDDFYIDIEATFTNTPNGNEWINFGSGLLNGFPVPKFQSSMIRYDSNPSDDINSEYYILGGSNNDSQNLDLFENLSAVGNGFNYISSYDITEVSGGLEPLITARHGAGAEYSDADGSPSIYLIGGYTSARDDTFVDIGFDI